MRPLTALGRRRSGPKARVWGDDRLFWSALTGEREEIGENFSSYVQHAYKGNGVIFACILVRQLVFSEARFQFQAMRGGRPADLFGSETLSLLERPWPNGTTGELLSRMEQDASLAGNFFATTRGEGRNRRLRRLRPDWVTIVTGSPSDDPFDLDAEVAGYIYAPPGGGEVMLTPDEVVHYSPIPDPDHQWRGMSWLSPVLNEIRADSAATRHKLKFFEHGATTNFVVSYDPSLTREQFEAYVEVFERTHKGVDNAYKTVHLGGGADVTTVGADLKQLDFKATQGAGETRIAAAAGVHPTIIGLSEGMQGSSLNAGNYGQVRRRLADGTIRPLWRMAAAALEKVVDTPPDARLWYDERHVAFLSQDAKDAAEIERTKANTINTLITAGFTPASVVAAVDAEDLRLLEHTGLTSVQLTPPGSTDD